MRIHGHVDVISTSEVKGWATDEDRPDTAVEIEIFRDGETIARCKPNLLRPGLVGRFAGGSGNFGFAFAFDPAIITPCVIEVMANGVLLPRGRRTLESPGHPDLSLGRAMVPIFITSTGRSGTTLLMQDLGQQPDIVVAGSYPWEMKFASHAAATHSVLISPHSPNDDAQRFAEIASKEGRAVGNPWNTLDLLRNAGGPHLISHFRESAPARLADALRGIVLDAYRVIAVGQGKTPRFFAEKGMLNEASRQAMRTLFGRVREIVLLRDPRDYLCSARSFWGADIEKGLNDLRSQFPIIEQIPEAREDVLFLRYEDLVLEPATARAALYRFLTIADPAPAGAADAAVLRQHATTADPAASIGRWRQDLTPDQASACVGAFGKFMERFGYDRNNGPAATGRAGGRASP
jgi:hypothetical protein